MSAFSFRSPVTLQIVLLALPLTAILLGELQVLRATWGEYLRWAQGFVDVPRQIERVVDQIDEVLPPYGYIGYIDPDHSWLNGNSTRQFFLTQYELAPRVLIYNTQPNHVIYFSHRGEPLTDKAIPEGMRVLLQVRLDLAVLTRSP